MAKTVFLTPPITMVGKLLLFPCFRILLILFLSAGPDEDAFCSRLRQDNLFPLLKWSYQKGGERANFFFT